VLKQRSELSQAEPEFLAAENAMSKLARDSGGGAAERFRLAEMREQRADVVRLRGDLERAEPMIRETQAAFADLARGEPEDSRYGVRHARSLLLLGDLYREEHRDAAATSAHEECISRLEALLARPTHDERCRELLATAEGALAHDLYMLKELAQSAEHGEESLRLLRELIADHPQVARLYDQYFLTADNLSVAYGESKQPERGLAVLEEGIARLKRASETLPDRANVRRTLALAETNACSLLTQLDHSDEAYERLSRVIPSMRDELRATPEDRRLRSMVVVTTLNLADLSMDRGRHAEAATLLREMPQPTSASELVHAAGQLAYCRQLALEDKVASEAERAAAVKAYEAGLLAFLDHAIEQGLADPGPLESNKDFDAVRAMPEFQARLARVRQRAKAK
jgi:tetratricopeptide (TPR) repeat protein